MRFVGSKTLHNILRTRVPCRQTARVGPLFAVQRGFAFVEALVAMSLLTALILGPLFLIGRALEGTTHSGKQFSATFFAEEAVEYLKHKRDASFSAYLAYLDNPKAKTDGFKDPFVNNIKPCLSERCVVDTLEDKIRPCPAGAFPKCALLTHHKTTRLFGHHAPGGNWEESGFYRWVEIRPHKENGKDVAYKVTAFVRYEERGVQYTTQLTRYIFDLSQAVQESACRARGDCGS
ncbi:MAG: hypothetical protein KatS3mg099_407 [Candidatus Parcubacteria bacterium]|nr:MAG: hypothetical protein KatS3mg099_407 [Candidatus Parcubacteria bacterium]